MPVSIAFLYISLRDPSGAALQIVTRLCKFLVKELPPPQVPPTEPPMEIEAPFPEPFYIFLYPEKRRASLYTH
jgi:hypothetical protein